MCWMAIKFSYIFMSFYENLKMPLFAENTLIQRMLNDK